MRVLSNVGKWSLIALSSFNCLSYAADPLPAPSHRVFNITFPTFATSPSTQPRDSKFAGEATTHTLRLERNLLPRQAQNGITLPGVYEDTLLDSGAQGSSFQGETAYGSYNPQGLPRGWSAEYRLMQQRTQDSSGFATRQSSAGVLLSSYLDTPNYGLLSVNANFNSAQSATANQTATALDNRTQTWRIDQRNMPLTEKLSANHSAGHIYTPLPSLSRGYGRTTLSSHPIEGVAGEWVYGKDLTVNASGGHIGFFTGRDSQGFALQRGTLATFGGQVKLSGTQMAEESAHAALGLQVLQANPVAVGATTTSEAQPAQRALWTIFVWQGIAPWGYTNPNDSGAIAQRSGGLRLQGNLIKNIATSGASLEANWRTERLQHSGSAFYYQPDLRWGTANLASDLRGLAWRGEFASRAWSAGVGAEVASALTTPDKDANFMNGFARYRVNNKNAVAASMAVRTGAAQGQSQQITWDHTSDWGNTQWRMDSLHTQDTRSNRIGIDQRWTSSHSESFSTSLAQSRSSALGIQTNSVEWGLLASATWSKARLDANVRGIQNLENTGTRSNNLNANIDISWPLAPNWSLVGQLNHTQGQTITPLAIVAASTQAANTATSNNTNQTFILALRYQDRAGSATAPIGGTYGTGAGSIEGVVYFDEDRNKTRGTSEKGVEGVTIVLDRRFATRTDAQGRFKFPAVAAGSHSIELIPDNVPLPWQAVQSGSATVRVQVRDSSVVDFGLQRER